MEHDAQSSQRYKENWDDAVQASKNDAAEIAELKEAYALLFKAHAAERERCAAAVRAVPSHRWVDGSDQWGRPCPAKVVATKDDYVAAILGPNV